MSFAEKIGALMQRPNDDLVSKNEVPWWLKYSARGLGTFAGGVGIFFGVFNAVSDAGLMRGFSAVLADIWLTLVAFSCLVFEAPCCCMFFDYVQEASNYAEKRPYWNRAVYYMIASAVTLLIDISGITLVFGVVLIFCTGLLYGTMALGRKASPAEMRNNASSIYSSNNQQFPPAATSNSNLVEGAQLASFSNPFDSRV